ncbi:MAG: WG repeat-containing protein [Bacteroidales bacterium]|nr:WG repeat-containing protein [Bacteroidales bacterium]
MGRYVVEVAEEYFDWDDLDSHGNPKKKLRYTGEKYETNSEPENSVGLSVMSDGYSEKHTVVRGSSSSNSDYSNYKERGQMALNEYGNMPFTVVKELDEDLLLVCTDKQYSMGVVKKNSNKVVVPLAFNKIMKFGNNGLIKASLFKDYIFDRKGKELACYDHIHELKNGIALVEKRLYIGSDFGYIDDNAKQIIPVRFSKITNFGDNGLMKAHLHTSNNSDCDYIFDRNGKELACYDRINELKNGVARVEKRVYRSSNHGYIDDNAKEIIPPKYPFITDFDEDGYAYAKLDRSDPNKIKFDKTGKEIQ